MNRTLLLFSLSALLFLLGGISPAQNRRSTIPVFNSDIRISKALHHSGSNKLSGAGYMFVDFEDNIFPPTGWTTSYTGTTLYWLRQTSVSAFGMGSASLRFAFYLASAGTEQTILTNTFAPTVAGDSLKFDHAYATYTGGANDQLLIDYSTDSGTTWNQVALLLGGLTGELVTAPDQSTSFAPTANQWASKAFALVPGTNKIRFTAISDYGNNLYLDNIALGTPPPNDIAVAPLTFPSSLTPGNVAVTATVKNAGSATQASFDVTAEITPGGYSSTKTVTNLVAGATAVVTFDNWSAVKGDYTIKVASKLSGDENSANDIATAAVTITEATWSALAATPNAYSRSCAALVTKNGLDYIYQFGGGSATQLTSVAVYNVAANSWSTTGLAAIPSAVSSATAVPLGDSTIYLFGGESTAGLGKTFKYNFYTNTWSTLAAMPTAVTDALVLKSGELVYVIGGNNGNFDTTTGSSQSTVQIYNSKTDSYSTGTALPYGVAMAAGGLANNKIIVAGGWDTQNAIDSVLLGAINVSDPTQIAWTVSPKKYPAGAIARAAAYVEGVSGPNPGVAFTGGLIDAADPTGKTYVYDFNTDLWHNAPDLSVPRSNMKAAGKGSREVYVVAGYNGSSGVGNLDKLTLEADPTATLSLGSPIGGENWGTGTRQTIKWTANLVPSVKIEYTTDGGTNWLPVTVVSNTKSILTSKNSRNHKNVSAKLLGAGSYVWTIPNTPSTACKVRISDASNPAVNSASPSSFTIVEVAPVTVIFEDQFDNDNSVEALEARGWTVSDNDGGGDTPAFGQGAVDVFSSYDGPDTGYVASNYYGANGTLIDQWLISPPVKVAVGDSLTFWHRSPDADDYSDSLFVRLSPTGDKAIASFTQELDHFRTSVDGWAYWSQPFTQSGTVRFAIQYYMEDGGPDGTNSDYVGIDALRVIGGKTVDVKTFNSTKPKTFALEQNYPNPFNPVTVIGYQVPVTSHVTLTIYNALGKEIATLVNQEKPAGQYKASFNASNLPSGIYFYRICAGNFTAVKKLMLVK